MTIRGRFQSTNGPMPIAARGKTHVGLAPASSREAPLATSRRSAATIFAGAMEHSWDSCSEPVGSSAMPAAAAQVTLSNVEAYISRPHRPGAVGHRLELHLQAAPSRRAAGADGRLLLARRDREGHRADDGAAVEVRPAGVHRAARRSWADLGRQKRKDSPRSELIRARGVRNGLMIALLALCPIRIKNFAALEIGHTFKEVHGSWWIALPSISTKSRRPDERRVPELLNHLHRRILEPIPPASDWIKAVDKRPLDLVHHRAGNDHKEPRHIGLQDYA